MGNVFMQSRHFVYGVVICRDVAFHKKMTKNGGFMHFIRISCFVRAFNKKSTWFLHFINPMVL